MKLFRWLRRISASREADFERRLAALEIHIQDFEDRFREHHHA